MKKEDKTLEIIIEGNAFQIARQYVSGAEIRALGNIAADHELYLAIKEPWEDELIKDSDQVDLARPGIEHFFSKGKDVKVVIIVNGTPKNWVKRKITFKEVILLAYGTYLDKPTMVYTVAYEDGPRQNPEGSMVKDSIVHVKDKMIFHATATDKS